MADATDTLFLCGDVMTGRGIDQLFPVASEPTLHETYMDDARAYVALAERESGAIRRPVDPAYVWGDGLAELERVKPAARIINLETSITTSDAFWPAKGIHYRMHPANIGVLERAGIDVATLANNHLLDFGRSGLAETLVTLQRAGIRSAGAGRDLEDADAGAWLPTVRLRVFAVGAESSGVDADWAATRSRPGVSFLPDLSAASSAGLCERVESAKSSGERVVVSIHWGSNWGYAVSEEQVGLAHRLVEAGADVVFGHSSHHPRPIEVYRDRLVLYGCGDFINDYEGIRGYDEFRGELRLMYFVALDQRGRLRTLRMVPLRSERLSLRSCTALDTSWLRTRLARSSRRFGAGLTVDETGALVLRRP